MDSSVPPAAAPAEEASLFDGIDTTIPGLASLVGGTPPAALVAGLRAIADHVSAAQKQFDAGGTFAAAPSLLAGSPLCAALRQQLRNDGLSAEARFNIDARLKTKEDQFTEAAMLAHGLRIEVLSDDGVVVPGQDVRVSISIGDRGRPVTVSSVALDGFAMPAKCSSGPRGRWRASIDATRRRKFPASARITKPYWKPIPKTGRYEFEPDAPFGLPFRPTPFRASFTLTAGGTELHVERPVEFRYEGQQLEGEKRMELAVVPRLALRVDAVNRDCSCRARRHIGRRIAKCASRSRITAKVRRRARCAWTRRRDGRRRRQCSR